MFKTQVKVFLLILFFFHANYNALTKEVKIFTKNTPILIKKNNPYASNNINTTKIIKIKSNIHIYMTVIRSQFTPEILQAKIKNTIYFHITNIERNFNIPHIFILKNISNSLVLIRPKKTKTLIIKIKKHGIYRFCSDIDKPIKQYIVIRP